MSACLHGGSYFGELSDYFVIIVSFVRHLAMAAVFYTVLISKIAATVFSQHIKRAITKQTVKIVRVDCTVTREKLTIPMAKKLVVL